MDDRRFDAMVRSLATGTSRRAVLRTLAGLVGGGIAASSLADAGAARRSTPSPTPAPNCPGVQLPSNGQCVCPADAPNKCGPDCCTGAPGDLPGPGHSECCDNACCFGACYGEELCCPYPRAFCPITGECCPEGWTCCPDAGCLPPGQCCTALDCAYQTCQAAICTDARQCSYVPDCSAEPGCCQAEVCFRSDCTAEGTCAEPEFDCTYNNNGEQNCCEDGLTCQLDGSCVCVPNCNGTCGGPDGCGGTCECASGSFCNGAGICRACGTCAPPYATCGSSSACRVHCSAAGEEVCVDGSLPCDASPGCTVDSDCTDGFACVGPGCCGAKLCLRICD